MNHSTSKPIQQGPSYQQIKKRWNKMSPVYITMDSAPQTFFYTLSNMLKLNQAKNILQIACGAGKLIPSILDLKSPQTFYVASDISEQMLNFAKLRLENHFNKYQSKLTLDEWMKKQKLQFKLLNGQIEKYQNGDIKFDRIICNLVLMLTTDPRKMLNNLWEQASDDCMLGLTVWGDKEKNLFFGFMDDFNRQHNLIPKTARSNFFLYPLIEDLVQECGWQKVLSWEQNGMFPIIEHSQSYIHPYFKDEALKNIPQELHPKFHQKINQLINQKKCGLTFSCKLMIVKKKLNKNN